MLRRGKAEASSCAATGPAAARTPIRTSSGGGVHGAMPLELELEGACTGPPPYWGGGPPLPGVPYGTGCGCIEGCAIWLPYGCGWP